MHRQALQVPIRRSLALLPLLLLAASACSSRVAPPEPPISIRRGDDAYARQDYQGAISQYQIYADSVEQGLHTPRVLYKSAMASYRLGRHAAALATLDELGRRYPNAEWTQVEALRGDCQRELGQRLAALDSWEDAWSEANDVDRPKLRARIHAVLPELSTLELRQAADVLDQDDVSEMVAIELARRKQGALSPEDAAILAAADADRRAGETDLYPSDTLVGALQRAARPGPTPPAAVAAAGVESPPPAEPVAPEPEIAVAEAEAAPEVAEASADIPEDWPAAPEIDLMSKLEVEEEFPSELAPPVRFDLDNSKLLTKADIIPLEALPAGGSLVGCIVPLTGKDRDLGEHVLRGLRMVFGDSDRLTVRDSGSNPEIAVRLLQELADDPRVLLSIVAPGPGQGAAIATAGRELPLPTLVLSDDGRIASSHIVPVGSDLGRSKSDMIAAIVEHTISAHGLRRFGILRPENAEAAEFARLFEAEVARHGGEVVATREYDQSDPGITIRDLYEWRQNAAVEAVFVPDDAVKVAAFAYSVQAEIPQLWVLGFNHWGNESNPGFNGIVFTGGLGIRGELGRSVAFVARYRQAYGVFPDARDVQAYDAGALARALLERGAQSRPQVFASLSTIGPVEGAGSGLLLSQQRVQRDLLQLHFHEQPVPPPPLADG